VDARDMGLSWLKDREPNPKTGADISRRVEERSIGVVKALVRGGRCEANWRSQQGSPVAA